MSMKNSENNKKSDGKIPKKVKKAGKNDQDL